MFNKQRPENDLSWSRSSFFIVNFVYNQLINLFFSNAEPVIVC